MAEPFITLSFENSGDSSASEFLDNSTPLSTPPSATHDTSRASFHIKDLETFAKDLQTAADRAFPNEGRRQSRYADVSVLLLRWEDDEMNVEWELDDLEKVFLKYGFNTERWLIPHKNAHLKLMSKAVDVVEQHERDDGQEGLVIVYYAGHAFINNARQAAWSCKADPSYASLEWSAIQTLFEKANFDVLLLLDCCAAASAAPSIGSAVTETIAACGFESIAPQPGRFSFTNTLIEVLEDWIDSPPFSAAMLHNKVLSVLKHERPERAQNGPRRLLECRRTPIHIVATSNPRLPSIELGRRILSKEPPQESKKPQTADGLEDTPSNSPFHPESTSGTKQPDCGNSRKRKQLHAETSDDINDEIFDTPKVIISLALERHQNLTSDSCQQWLASCPTIVRYAKVEAVFKAFSVLVLLSIPVSIWDLLSEDPACSFIGYITSCNLLSSGPQKQQSISDRLPLSDPRINDFKNFTASEDTLLLRLKSSNLDWDQISKCLPGRPTRTLQDRYAKIFFPESEMELAAESASFKKARYAITPEIEYSERDHHEMDMQGSERILSAKFEVEIDPKCGTYEALQAFSRDVQHELSERKVFLSLQETNDMLLGPFLRSETRVSTLKSQQTVLSDKFTRLSEEKIRLEAQVVELQRNVEELSRSRDEYRQGAIYQGVRFAKNVKSWVDEFVAEEEKSWARMMGDEEENLGILTPAASSLND